jgi:hypothetical protein
MTPLKPISEGDIIVGRLFHLRAGGHPLVASALLVP